MFKGKKLHSILYNTCPKCQKGKFWPYSPYVAIFKKNSANYDKCDVCDLKYSIEPGFWQGAMYVSYGIGIAIMVTFWIATTVLLPKNGNVFIQIGVICGAVIFLFPLNYWLSRLIYLNIFIKYDPSLKTNAPSNT